MSLVVASSLVPLPLSRTSLTVPTRPCTKHALTRESIKLDSTTEFDPDELPPLVEYRDLPKRLMRVVTGQVKYDMAVGQPGRSNCAQYGELGNPLIPNFFIDFFFYFNKSARNVVTCEKGRMLCSAKAIIVVNEVYDDGLMEIVGMTGVPSSRTHV